MKEKHTSDTTRVYREKVITLLVKVFSTTVLLEVNIFFYDVVFIIQVNYHYIFLYLLRKHTNYVVNRKSNRSSGKWQQFSQCIRIDVFFVYEISFFCIRNIVSICIRNGLGTKRRAPVHFEAYPVLYTVQVEAVVSSLWEWKHDDDVTIHIAYEFIVDSYEYILTHRLDKS